MYFSVEVYRKDANTFVAFCSEFDTYSYGGSIEVAVERLKRVVNFYLESAEEMGLSLEELGVAQSGKQKLPRVSPHNSKAALN